MNVKNCLCWKTLKCVAGSKRHTWPWSNRARSGVSGSNNFKQVNFSYRTNRAATLQRCRKLLCTSATLLKTRKIIISTPQDTVFVTNAARLNSQHYFTQAYRHRNRRHKKEIQELTLQYFRDDPVERWCKKSHCVTRDLYCSHNLSSPPSFQPVYIYIYIYTRRTWHLSVQVSYSTLRLPYVLSCC